MKISNTHHRTKAGVVKRNPINVSKEISSISIKYSPINQAYLVMWHNQVLRIYNTKKRAEEFVSGLKLGIKGAKELENAEKR